MTLLNTEEKKENSKTTYKKSRQIGTRMKHKEDGDDEFSNRFGDYLGGGRAGGMSMRNGSMSSQGPKFSIHKKIKTFHVWERKNEYALEKVYL